MTSPEFLVPTLAEGASDHEGRLSRLALLTTDVAFFVAMAAFVVFAPCGDWENEAFGVKLWHNADPAGPYVISAVHFHDQRYPPFLGHPGTTLQLLIHLAARTAHGLLALGGTTAPFVAFWARHIAWLFALSSFVVAALHVVSFHALHAYARRLGMCRRTAFIVVLAYATSFPVLYYGTRVSPEPVLVTLTLVAFLLSDSCAAALASGRRLRACLLAGGAGAAAVLALFTKMHLAFPLVPLIVVQVLTQARPDARPLLRRIGESLVPAGVALASSVGTFLFCSLRVPWHSFIDFWSQYAPSGLGGILRCGSGDGCVASLWAVITAVAKAGGKNLTAHLHATAQGLFTVSEGCFVVLGSVGLVLLWRRRQRARTLIGWAVALCVCLLPVVAFRGLWHYYVLHVALAAVGFAHTIDAWLVRSDRGAGERSGGSVLRRSIVATLLVHAVSVTLFVAIKVNDVRSYRRFVGPYLSALDRLSPGTRAAIVSTGFKFWKLDGGYPNYIERDRLELTRTFESSGYVAKRAEGITPELVQRMHISCVIDATSGKVRLVPIQDWPVVDAPATP